MRRTVVIYFENSTSQLHCATHYYSVKLL